MSTLHPNLCIKLRDHGLKTYTTVNLIGNIAFRGPCKIFPYNWWVRSKVDMFSYTGVCTRLITSSIGRYCSIAEHVCLGVENPDTSTLSCSAALNESKIFDFANYHSAYHSPLRKQRHNVTSSRVTVGHDVWFGAFVSVPADVTIGHGSIIGSGAVVTKDVPPYSVVVGHDRIVKQRFSDEIVSDMLEINWWDYNVPAMLKNGVQLNMDDPKEFISQFKDLDPAVLIPVPKQWMYAQIEETDQPITVLNLKTINTDNFSLYADPRYPDSLVITPECD